MTKEKHEEHEGHDHAHSGPGHSHARKSFGTAFAIGTTLNFGFVVLEVVFGIYAHSLALVADAGHTGEVLQRFARQVRDPARDNPVRNRGS